MTGGMGRAQDVGGGRVGSSGLEWRHKRRRVCVVRMIPAGERAAVVRDQGVVKGDDGGENAAPELVIEADRAAALVLGALDEHPQ